MLLQVPNVFFRRRQSTDTITSRNNIKAREVLRYKDDKQGDLESKNK